MAPVLWLCVFSLSIYVIGGFFHNNLKLHRLTALYRERKPAHKEYWYKDVKKMLPDNVHKVNAFLCTEPTYMERAVAQNADMMLIVHPAHVINSDQLETLHKAVTGEPRYFRVNRDTLVKQLDGTKFTIVSDDLSDINVCFFFENEVQNVQENYAALKKWVSTKLYANEPLNIHLCLPTHSIRLFANNGKNRR